MTITTLVLLAVAVLVIGVVVSFITRSEHRRVEVDAHRRRASQLRAILEGVPPRFLGFEVARFLNAEHVRHLAVVHAAQPGDLETKVALDAARSALETVQADVAAPDPRPVDEADAVEIRRVLASAVLTLDKVTGDEASRYKSAAAQPSCGRACSPGRTTRSRPGPTGTTRAPRASGAARWKTPATCPPRRPRP